METHGGRESSRVKDLVDLAVYLSTEEFGAGELSDALRRDSAMRRVGLDGGFAVPQAWKGGLRQVYGRLAAGTGLDAAYREPEPAEALAASCVDPLVAGAVEGARRWSPAARAWA